MDRKEDLYQQSADEVQWDDLHIPTVDAGDCGRENRALRNNYGAESNCDKNLQNDFYYDDGDFYYDDGDCDGADGGYDCACDHYHSHLIRFGVGFVVLVYVLIYFLSLI